METPQVNPERTEAPATEFDDVDELIRELETRFEDSQQMPMAAKPGSASCNCTNAHTCTGTCPCAQ